LRFAGLRFLVAFFLRAGIARVGNK
jgi:hypothetical protein